MKQKEDKLDFRLQRLEEFAFDGQSISSFQPEEDDRVWDPADLDRKLQATARTSELMKTGDSAEVTGRDLTESQKLAK